MFYVPFGRDFCLWLGCVDASRSTAEKVLDAGHSIYVYPGGVPEIFLTNPYSKKVETIPPSSSTGDSTNLVGWRPL